MKANDVNREELEELERRAEYDRITAEYNKAYYRTVFCPEWELPEAKRMLAIWRHKWFNA